jgi:hypothetical protein
MGKEGLLQTTDTILMIRPAHFGYNEQTAGSNVFQKKDTSISGQEIQSKALQEFDDLVDLLREKGVEVVVIEDADAPFKPDAVFPNNWVTFHQDGTIVTYPMYAELRREERREDVLKVLTEKFEFPNRVHMEQYELQDRFLEGTGSMVLDRPNKIAYACISPRTDVRLLNEFCEKFGYEKVSFTAVDRQNQEIYHTNVMMALGETFVVICLDTVRDDDEHDRLVEKFNATGKEVIEITISQMESFAGNMLQVRNKEGQTFLVMSEQAYHSLNEDQVKKIKTHTGILFSPIPTIETFGGGSARCMMAEVFYPGLKK